MKEEVRNREGSDRKKKKKKRRENVAGGGGGHAARGRRNKGHAKLPLCPSLLSFIYSTQGSSYLTLLVKFVNRFLNPKQ